MEAKIQDSRKVSVDEKLCVTCKEVKLASDFYASTHHRDGLYSSCKSCHYARTSAWVENNRGRVNAKERERYAAGGDTRKRSEKRLRKYGLTIEAYQTLMDEQGGACAICLLPFVEGGASGSWDIASVDHCHGTGKVRGILHRRCNLALELGLTEDDWRRATEYLAFHSDEKAKV